MPMFEPSYKRNGVEGQILDLDTVVKDGVLGGGVDFGVVRNLALVVLAFPLPLPFLFCLVRNRRADTKIWLVTKAGDHFTPPMS